MKNQILIIHGGMTFKRRADYLDFLRKREIKLKKSKRWHREYLDEKLGKNFEIIRPSMPLAENARYEDWKIHFERYFEFLRDDLILIGNSLGGIFLAKYLSENKFPKKIKKTILVAPPFDDTLSEEDLAGGFELGDDLTLLEKNSSKLYLFFSADDPVVPPAHAEKYARKLDKAYIKVYKNKKGHFQVRAFPELIKVCQN